jgi:hypothetical protein
MKDLEIRERFMALRAQNKSYAAIERELGVTKKTLISWGKEHRERIANLQAIELEALQEEYGLTARARVARFGEELRRVTDELARRDLSTLPTWKLYDLLVKLNAQLKAEAPPPIVRSDDEVRRDVAVRKLLERVSAVDDSPRGTTIESGNGKVDADDLIKLQLETYRAYLASEIDEATALRRIGMLAPLTKAAEDAALQERLARLERILAEKTG